MGDTEDIAILRCPVTGQHLRSMTERAIGALNTAIRNGQIAYLDGDRVQNPLAAAVQTLDGALAYARQGPVYILLQSLALRLVDSVPMRPKLRGEKELVQQFYQEIGWTRNNVANLYEDTARFVDLRPVSQEYRDNCHKRLKKSLPSSGRYFLDAASGAIPHQVYLAYSAGYYKHICVDLSYEAMAEAHWKLGDRGLYIMGDVTDLPLMDGTVDAAISLHTIYHVPADEQRTAFDEIHRVLAPGARALVVYSFGTCAPLVRALLFPRQLWARILKSARIRTGCAWRETSKVGSSARLYFHAHPYRWFTRQRWCYSIEIRSWRSLGKETLQLFHGSIGRYLLRCLFGLESLFPRLMGAIGQYPLIVVQKAPAPTGSESHANTRDGELLGR